MEGETAVVRDPLYAALRVLRVLGVAPLRFTRRHTVTNVRVRVWNALVYYGYFMTTIFNVMIILDVSLQKMENSRTVQDVTKVGLAIFIVYLCSSIVTVSAAGYRARRRMTNMILQLNNLNKITILPPGDCSLIAMDGKRALKFTLGALIQIFVFVIDFSLSLYRIICINPRKYEMVAVCCSIVFYVYGATAFLLEMQIMSLITSMQTALKSYNCELKRMLHVIATGYRNEGVSFSLKESMGRVARYYATLCENVRQMNRREGALMLLMLALLVMHVMFNVYNVFVELHSISHKDNSKELRGYLNIALRLIAAVFYVLLTGALVDACDNVQTEIQKMLVMTSELMYRSREAGETISAAAVGLCKPVLILKPNFKPLGMCVLTRSLFITLTSGVFTYLISVVKVYFKEESVRKE